MKDSYKCRNIWKSRKGRKYNIFRFEESHRIKLFHLSSRDLFLTMKFICSTRSDRDRMRKEKKKKRTIHKARSPILSNLSSKIRKSLDPERGQMPRHASLIKLNDIYATCVCHVRSFHLVLDFQAPLWRYFFSIFLCGCYGFMEQR